MASIAIFFWAINGLSNILTPIAIAILIWFLINAFADQIKRIPFLNNKIGDFEELGIDCVKLEELQDKKLRAVKSLKNNQIYCKISADNKLSKVVSFVLK